MDFEQLKGLYEKYKKKYGKDAYRKISLLLGEAKIIHNLNDFNEYKCPKLIYSTNTLAVLTIYLKEKAKESLRKIGKQSLLDIFAEKEWGIEKGDIQNIYK
jgi:hypothetical protein